MLKRIANSAVIWSWVLNGLRAVSGVIVLSLLWRSLSPSEFGMAGVLTNLAVTVPLVFDFGFGPTIGRFIAYAMVGAEKLEAIGISQRSERNEPNYALLWELLDITRKLYRYLTLAVFVVIGVGGTLLIEHLIRREQEVDPDFSLPMARWAWAITLLSTLLDIYSNWWAIYLKGLNQVRSATKVTTLAVSVKLVLTTTLLLSGAGLLSLPIAGIIASYLQRYYARVRCLQRLPPRPAQATTDLRKTFAALWPNSWRQGVQIMTNYLVLQVNTLVCAHVYHLEISGQYTASAQLMGYASSMAAVWTMVKWPLVGQYQARHDFAGIQQILWSRIWLQLGTFVTLAGLAIFVAPELLHWIRPDKQLLPFPWLVAMAVYFFLEMLLSTAGSLIASGNRLPFIWHAVAFNLLSLILSLALLQWSSLGLGAFVAGPLLSGALFNYWYWPVYAARSIKTKLLRFLFFGPAKNSSGLAPNFSGR